MCFGRTSIFGSTHSISVITSMILVFWKWRDQVGVIKTDNVKWNFSSSIQDDWYHRVLGTVCNLKNNYLLSKWVQSCHKRVWNGEIMSSILNIPFLLNPFHSWHLAASRCPKALSWRPQVNLAASSWSKTTTDDLSISQNLIAIK